jgi:hypothetical protein
MATGVRVSQPMHKIDAGAAQSTLGQYSLDNRLMTTDFSRGEHGRCPSGMFWAGGPDIHGATDSRSLSILLLSALPAAWQVPTNLHNIGYLVNRRGTAGGHSSTTPDRTCGYWVRPTRVEMDVCPSWWNQSIMIEHKHPGCHIYLKILDTSTVW